MSDAVAETTQQAANSYLAPKLKRTLNHIPACHHSSECDKIGL
jgi:hypothetical protein